MGMPGPVSVTLIPASVPSCQVCRCTPPCAVKYTAHGGGHLHTWQDGTEAGISVTDTGPGIPMEELHRVFGRFYRTDTARTRSVDGSGLGLAIAEEIVHAHRGRIWAERDEDGGTRVSFALPLAG